MKEILKFNFKRIINKWYIFLILIFLAHIFLYQDIINFFLKEKVELNKISSLIRIQFLNLANILIIMIFLIYLYNDYQSGIWNYMIATKLKSKIIVITYFLNGFIISLINLIIYFVVTIIFYSQNIQAYGIYNFINDNFMSSLILILFIISLMLVVFKIIPNRKDIGIGILVLYAIFSYFFATIALGLQTNNTNMNLLISIIPIINLLLINSINQYFWISILVNLSIIIGNYSIFIIRK